MMDFIEYIKERVRPIQKKIILPEASDERVLKAASLIKEDGFATIVLVGDKASIQNHAAECGFDIDGIEILDPKTFPEFDALSEAFYELRKAKGMTKEKAKELLLTDELYFANMLVKMGYADGIVSGAIHSTADTLRPALQIIKVAPGVKVASCFLLMDVPNCEHGENGIFIYSDCGMIQNPTSDELVEIAAESAKTFELLVDAKPVVAFLSHSTFGSSHCSDVDKVVTAVKKAKTLYPDIEMDGELQFDAAVVPSVAEIKAPNSPVAGKANVLIFPDLDAGNIGYKITERLAHAKAYGPVSQGLAKPVNDLSRGCCAEDIVGVVAITALQAK